MKLVLITMFLYSFSVFAQVARIDLEDLRSTVEKSKVIVLGEVHYILDVKKHHPEIITEIQRIDPEYNCLAVEFSATQQQSFDIVGNQVEYRDFIDQYLRAVPSYAKQLNGLTEDKIIASVDRFTSDYISWYFASEVMKKSGGRVFLIDDLSQRDAQPDKDDFDFRNRAMAEQIASHVKSGECKKIISINGNAHILFQYTGSTILKYLAGYKPVGFSLGTPNLPPFADLGLVKVDVLSRLK